MSLIGSYSFLGRLEEAKQLWNSKQSTLSPEERSRARFAMAVAHTRISKFKFARTLLKESLDCETASKLPDVYQGIAVYHFYLGKFDKAALQAKKALRLALETGDNYMHAFSIDLYGHSLVQIGKRSAGLRKLAEAKALSNRKTTPDIFTTAKLLYEAESGHRPSTIVSELESAIAIAASDDSYTRANLTLELARQLTLRGDWLKARLVLDGISNVIYGFENRRQESILQLRLAELAYRQGDFSGAQHFTQAARRWLNKISDRAYEVRVLGLEIKIDRKLSGRLPAVDALQRLQELANESPYSINARIFARATNERFTSVSPGEDPLGDLLDHANQLSKTDTTQAAQHLLNEGYLGLWPEAMNLTPGASSLVVMENGSWVASRKDGVFYSKPPLSKQNFSLLKCLSNGLADKEQLTKIVWGYDYDPLRHDSMIYTALAALRKALGPIGHWVETRDDGWTLHDRGFAVSFVNKSGENVAAKNVTNDMRDAASDEFDEAQLNWRQIKALNAGLSKKRTNEPWTVPDYKDVFHVSTMTAWRDLDGLAKTGYLKRIGKGRATVYLPLSQSLLKENL